MSVPDYFHKGDRIGNTYEITEVLTVGGQEAGYRAVSETESVLLYCMLPLHWCRMDPGGMFLPYNESSADSYTDHLNISVARLQGIAKHTDDEALPKIRRIISGNGTLWYAVKETPGTRLSERMERETFSHIEAVELLAPVMDALAGLHEEGIPHGAISPEHILLTDKGSVLLDGWLASEGRIALQDDVRALSLLLWQMMTGCTIYRWEDGRGLPEGIRNALHNGLYDQSMTIAQLWTQLHTRKPAPRTASPQSTADEAPSILSKIFNPVVTAVFCLACVAAPFIMWHRQQPVTAQDIPEQVQKMADVAYAPAEDEICMPELLYQDQAAATEQLEALGLRVILASRKDNPVVPEDAVVSQTPSAGSILHKGDTVTLALSGGWSNYVPDVTDTSFQEAKDRLESLGFIAVRKEVYSDEDAPETVIAQSVKADRKLARDSEIMLTVSLGREDVDTEKKEKVGDYVGEEFAKAKETLAGKHLYAMQIETVYDADTPAGIILSQDIEAGEWVPQGTVINMTVSMGVETTRVPGVVQLGADAATEMLRAAGLKPYICYVSNGDYVMDCVLTQSIEEGSLVAVGTEVWMTASIGTASYVISTGGWSGNPLPTVEWTTEETEEEEEEETEEEEQDTTERPDATEAPTYRWTEAPQTQAPTAAPVYTDPPYVPQTEPEITAPPAPVIIEPEPGDLEPPPMPVQN